MKPYTYGRSLSLRTRSVALSVLRRTFLSAFHQLSSARLHPVLLGSVKGEVASARSVCPRSRLK